jgi:hypothetical protein
MLLDPYLSQKISVPNFTSYFFTTHINTSFLSIPNIPRGVFPQIFERLVYTFLTFRKVVYLLPFHSIVHSFF